MNQNTQPNTPPIRVMIVDDHPTMLWGLEKLISSERPRMEVVSTASNAEEAFTQLRSVVPDVVLLDLDLDGQNGLDLLPALLVNPTTRVLILTGERQQSVLDQAVQKGARGILQKNASAQQVLKAIQKTHEGELWLDRSTVGRVFSEFRESTATEKSDPDAEMRSSLTGRERKIIHMIVEGQGATNNELAERLFISPHTLRNHLTSIYSKLNLGNRLELYVYAVKHQMGSEKNLKTPSGY
ncbi:MAG: response regulator transcription factor [Polaromonas sp.]|nr:response regulator transcription factor [Polaromonas sp.]